MNQAQATVLAVLVAGFATVSQAAAAEVDRSADAAKGKAIVAAHCVECHAGVWEGETYESTLAILQAVNSGQQKHRFKITKLTDQEVKQVAAYWAPK